MIKKFDMFGIDAAKCSHHNTLYINTETFYKPKKVRLHDNDIFILCTFSSRPLSY